MRLSGKPVPETSSIEISVDQPISLSGPDTQIDTSDKLNILVTENASGARVNQENYVSLQNRSAIDLFLTSLGEECRGLLDDPHISDSLVLMDSLLSVAFVYNDIRPVLEDYEQSKMKRRESELPRTLSELYCKRKNLKRMIIEEMQVNISPKLGLLTLRTNADRKNELIKDIALNSMHLKSFIEAKGLKLSLKRRVRPIKHVSAKNSPYISNQDKETVMICFNN